MTRASHLSTLRTPHASANARELRCRMTDAELKFWYHVRNRAFRGFKFRKQVPLGDHVVDFLCEELRLIVEIDGGHHAERLHADEARSRWLRTMGYRVARFWNNDVLGNIDGVLDALSETLDPPPAPSQGRGKGVDPPPAPSHGRGKS